MRRPVLTAWRRSLLKRVLVPADSLRATELDVPLPERMRTGRLRLDAQVYLVTVLSSLRIPAGALPPATPRP